MIALYHGSNVRIEKIDLSLCHPYKDFGKAFYLTSSKEQALELAKARVDFFGGEAVVNAFRFENELLANGELSFKSFEEYSEDWADFIYKHRDESFVPPYMHSFDVVYGPIANDRVGLQIRNLRMGNIDRKEFLRRLHYMKGITFQYAFCTERAIKALQHDGSK